jgi:hypothetical protein
MDEALIFSWELQLAQEPLNIFKPELDSKTLSAVKPGERFPVAYVHDVVEK